MQGMQAARLPPQRLLGREGGDDFFEAGIAAQRVPMGIETEVAIGYAQGHFRKGFELLNSQVALASPGTDHGKEIKDLRASVGIFCNRDKLERQPTLAQRLFLSPEPSINQS